MQAVKCSPADLKAINGNTHTKPKATLACWFHRFFPSALLSSRRIHRNPPDAPQPEGHLEEDTGSRGKHADTRGFTNPPIPVSSRPSVPSSDSATAANDVPSSTNPLLGERVHEESMEDRFILSTTKDPSPQVIRESSTKVGVREDSTYVDCRSESWSSIFVSHLTPGSTNQRVASPWQFGCLCCWIRQRLVEPEECECTENKEDVALIGTGTPAFHMASGTLSPACHFLVNGESAVTRGQHGDITTEALQSGECDPKPPLPSPAIHCQQSRRQQRSPHEPSVQEGQPQPNPKGSLFGPVAWVWPTSLCALMFSSCVGHPTPLHHEGVEATADSQEDKDDAALKSYQGNLWSERNLQLACGTRCRKLRRVKDEGRQVWMEYQEVTLHDNSRRFQWVELPDDSKAAVD